MLTSPKSSFVMLSQKHADTWSMWQVYLHGKSCTHCHGAVAGLVKFPLPLVDTSETFLLLCEVEQSLHGSREAVSFLLGDLPAAAFLCCFESIAAIPL